MLLVELGNDGACVRPKTCIHRAPGAYGRSKASVYERLGYAVFGILND